MSLLVYARTVFHEGTPVSCRFNDTYYHAAQGFAESDHVFIHDNRLMELFHALSDGQDFTIGEIGFGTGLNLLNVSRHFLDLAPRTQPTVSGQLRKIPDSACPSARHP